MGCSNLGFLEYKAEKKTLAKKLFAKAWDLNFGEGCKNLGAFESEAGNKALAQKYWKKACSLGYKKACN